MTASTQPTILIIDDDATIGRSLKRLSEQSFPDFQVLWVKNGVIGIELARRYAQQLRLVVLDVKMDLLDGTLVAVQLPPDRPMWLIMPFTSYTEALPTLVELGCACQPALKRPETMREMPDAYASGHGCAYSPPRLTVIG